MFYLVHWVWIFLFSFEAFNFPKDYVLQFDNAGVLQATLFYVFPIFELRSNEGGHM